ncbi:MAG: hypothetical protein ACRDID_18725 [Ktedonobacterales bacterium]
MALDRKRDPRVEELIAQAVADVERLNPHINASWQPMSDADSEEVAQNREQLERIWQDIEQQHGGQCADEPAVQAVDEDRGA